MTYRVAKLRSDLMNLKRWLFAFTSLLLLAIPPGTIHLATPQADAPAAKAPLLELDPGGHKALTRGLAFSARGRYLVSGSDDKTLRIYLTETGELLRTYRGWSGPGFDGAINSLALSPDDRLLAVGGVRGDGGFLRILDFASGEVLQLLEGHTSNVIKLAFTPDGRSLVSTQTGKGPVLLWRRSGRSFRLHRRMLENVRDVYGLAIGSDGRHIATAGFDGHLALFDSEGKLLRRFEGLRLNRLAFAPDAQRLAGSAFDRKLHVFAVNELFRSGAKTPGGRVVAELPKSHYGDKHIEEIAWSPAGLFSAGPFRPFEIAPDRSEYRRPIYLLDPDAGRVRAVYAGHTNTVMAIVPGPGGLMASSGGNDHDIHLWRAKDAALQHRIRGAGQSVFAVAFGRDGHTIYFGNTNRASIPNAIGPLTRSFSFDELEVCELAEGPAPETIRGPVTEHGDTAITYKNELYNPTIEIGRWRVTLSQENDTVFAYSLSPDGKTAVLGTALELLAIDVESGDPIGRFQGHEGPVMEPATQPRPRLFVAAFGVDEYADRDFAPLSFAVKDAREFAALFEALGKESFPGGVKVFLKTDAQVERESLGKLTDFWKESSVDDTVLVYFSGHGLSRPVTRTILGREFEDYRFYFATGQTDLASLNELAIPIDDIRRALETTPSRQKMLFIDACQTFVELPQEKRNAAPGATTAEKSATRGGGPATVLRLKGGGKLLFGGARSTAASRATARRSRQQADSARFFPELRRGTGTIEVSAAIDGQAALEGVVLANGEIIENGVFTYSIQRALAAREARDANGRLTARGLRNFVLDSVETITTDEAGRPQQTPMVARDIAGRDFTLSAVPPRERSRPADLHEQASFYRSQIACPPESCYRLPFRPGQLKGAIRAAMVAGRGKILVEIGDADVKFQDDEFEELLAYMRAVAARGGRVLIDPVEGQTKSAADLVPIPVVKDVLLLGLDIWNRLYGFFYYRPAGDYHARAIFDRKTDRIKLVYFLHKAAGDPCAELLAQCDVVHYVDDELFDSTLSDRLRLAAERGTSVRVVFDRQPARLPAAEIDLELLKRVKSSARLYKWLLVSGKAEKQKAAGEKAIGLTLAISIIDYSLKAYDLLHDIILYAPARKMQARVYYEGAEWGGSIKSVVFRPLQE